MFGMHLRPELVLLQKTMVQVEGVSRALDPQHDMWNASRPIVERWVERELGPEAVARRAIDEIGHGFAALRRLPHTLAAVEAAARKVSADPPREERRWYQSPTFWIGLLAGAVLALVLTAGSRREEPSPQTPEIATVQEPMRAGSPSATAPIPPAEEDPPPEAATEEPASP
jgi:ubiquinone biosynthesis protein